MRTTAYMYRGLWDQCGRDLWPTPPFARVNAGHLYPIKKDPLRFTLRTPSAGSTPILPDHQQCTRKQVSSRDTQISSSQCPWRPCTPLQPRGTSRSTRLTSWQLSGRMHRPPIKRCGCWARTKLTTRTLNASTCTSLRAPPVETPGSTPMWSSLGLLQPPQYTARGTSPPTAPQLA